MNHDERQEVLERHAKMLREHFDSVQIIATRLTDENDGTAIHEAAQGCWYARFGACQSFVIRCKESERIRLARPGEHDDEE